MGYIAPVNNYQYNHYAERELKNDYNPFHIVPVGKVKRVAHAHSQKMAEGEGARKTIKKKRAEIKKIKQRVRMEETYSEITGKGRYFDECV